MVPHKPADQTAISIMILGALIILGNTAVALLLAVTA